MTGQAVLHPGIWRPVLTLILTSVLIMGSPGPSTLSATAFGAAYGFRRSLIYVGGLVFGTIAVLFAVAAGIEALLFSIPHGGPALFSLSLLYILYLAFQIASAPPLASRRDRFAAPGSGWSQAGGGFLLAIANPKAYLAIAAVFAGAGSFATHHALGAAVKIALLSLMIVIIHLFWLLAGAALSRLLQDAIISRTVNVSLAAALVVATAIALLG